MSKFSIVLFALVLMALAPALQANSISAPAYTALDHVTTAATATANQPLLQLPIPLPGGGGSTNVPEPSSIAPVVILLSGLWLMRKRLLATR